MLELIDANTGSPDLGWDTDQFPMDIRVCTAVMLLGIRQDGVQSGGLNFDAEVRRESTNANDLFIAHINAMVSLARGLRNAARIFEDDILSKHLKARYSSFESGFVLKLAGGVADLEECKQYVYQRREPEAISVQQEHVRQFLIAICKEFCKLSGVGRLHIR